MRKFSLGDEVLTPTGSVGCIRAIENIDGVYRYYVETNTAIDWVDEKSLDLRFKQNKLTGLKFDDEKPDLSLLPKSAKEGIARAFMHGEKKYGRYNYLGGMTWTRLIAAADRHLSAFNEGEDIDNESKLNHLFHAGACISMLIEYYTKNLGEDNRFKENGDGKDQE